jgi:predicted phage terminase large subunit-like protein
MTSDQNTKIRFDNDKGGYRIATSVDGTMTGDGGNVIVVDDPHNVKEIDSETMRLSVLEWWDKTASTRLNDPINDHYIVVCQRVHEEDLSGHILASEIDDGDWVHLMLPARFESERKCIVEVTGWSDPRTEEGELLWPERITEGVLAKLETRMGSYTAAGQLQQRPAPAGGGLFKRNWFEIVDELPSGGARARYWDLAATEEVHGKTPDWTVGGYGVFKDGVLYLYDFRRARHTPQKTELNIKAVAAMDGKMVAIYMEQEPGSSGKIVIDHYARSVLPGYIFYGDKKTGSKVEAARPLAAAAEAGNVKLVRGAWNQQFLNEIEVFPNGKFDDQVDVASGLHSKLSPGEPAGVIWV